MPATSALLLPAASRYMSPKILDIYLAISVIRTEIGSRASFPGQTQRCLARESMKLALRLVYLGQEASDTAVKNQTPTAFSAAAVASLQLNECLRLTALLFVWRFQRKISATSRPMRFCHGQVVSLLKSIEVRYVFVKSDDGSFGANLLLWMLIILGSTASSDSELQVCIELTRRHLPDRTHDKWERARSICETFLWLHREGQSPVEEFWKNVSEACHGFGDATR